MSKLNLNIIIQEVRAKIHDSSLSQSQISRWANIAQDKVLRSMDPDWLKESLDFSTAVDQREYALQNLQFHKVESVVDFTSQFPLYPVTEKEIDGFDPGHVRTGRPTMYAIQGIRSYETQLSVADTIDVASNHAADTTQTVLIKGTNGGYPVKETLTLAGTTTVNGTKTFTTITDVVKSDYTTGLVTFWSTAEVLGSIAPDALSMQLQTLILYPTPTDVRTIRVRYIRQNREMVDLQDEPDLPDMWKDLVLWGTMQQAHEFVYEFAQASKMKDQFEDEVRKLHHEMGNTRDNRRAIKIPGPVAMKRYKGRLPEQIG